MGERGNQPLQLSFNNSLEIARFYNKRETTEQWIDVEQLRRSHFSGFARVTHEARELWRIGRGKAGFIKATIAQSL